MNQHQNRPRRFHHVPGTDPFTHQRTRDVQPRTKEDTRSLRRLIAGGAVAAAALVAANMVSNDDNVEGKTPVATTTAIAEEGDSYWSLQEAEGNNGRDIRHVVDDAMDLAANDRDADGHADPIHPGMEVTLLDDPNTPKP